MVFDNKECPGNCQSVIRLWIAFVFMFGALITATVNSSSAKTEALNNKTNIASISKKIVTKAQFDEFKARTKSDTEWIKQALNDIKKAVR